MAAKKTASAKKTAPKKAAKKTAKKTAPKVNRNPKPAPVPELQALGETGTFHVVAEYNDQAFEGNTDNIAESMLALAPVKLNTKVAFKFSLADGEKNEDGEPVKVVDKVFMIAFARRLFTNKMAATVFEKSIKLALGYDNGEKAQ